MPTSIRSQLLFEINEDNLPIRGEQIRARLRTYPLMIAVRVVVVLSMLALMWGEIDHVMLLSWVSAMLALHGLESFYLIKYRRAANTLAECKAWKNRLLVFVTLVAGVWGLGGVLLFLPNNLAYQSMLICIVVGVAAGAVTTNPVFPPALYIFETLLIVPIALSNLLVGDAGHWVMSGLLMLYLVYVLNAGKELADTFEISLRRTLENEELVQRLTVENQRAELAQQRAEQASISKSKFLAAASHDLRQPMHALTLFVEALKPHVAGVQGGRLMAQVATSVDVLGEMFEALLDISRLDAGVVLPHFQTFPAQQIFDRIEAEFTWVARDKGLALKVVYCACDLYTDPILLERILRNLIANAIRYTSSGSIEVRCAAADQGVNIEVVDTGIGIPEQHLPHIFEEYYQIGNTQRDRTNGLGLGLAIVQRLANLMGVEVKVSSKVAVGSCFSILIPDYRAMI